MTGQSTNPSTASASERTPGQKVVDDALRHLSGAGPDDLEKRRQQLYLLVEARDARLRGWRQIILYSGIGLAVLAAAIVWSSAPVPADKKAGIVIAFIALALSAKDWLGKGLKIVDRAEIQEAYQGGLALAAVDKIYKYLNDQCERLTSWMGLVGGLATIVVLAIDWVIMANT